MPKNRRRVIRTKSLATTKALMVAVLFIAASFPIHNISAASCKDLSIIFARGSGGERYASDDYNAFKNTIEQKIKTLGLSYKFEDLDYPAVGVGIDNLVTTIGAFVSGGEAYTFGDSVDIGVDNLVKIVNDSSCKNTKYVLGGYSQGAMVVIKALEKIDPDKIIYAATFGDPKLYLPEGKGLFPPACFGHDLSDYRVYVPDCMADEGLLGGKNPYRLETYIDKVGTWCNKFDLMCSSHFSIADHTSYVADNIYEDASRFITSKIGQAFDVKNAYTSPHDTAILIDSTGSMEHLAERYREEALSLAKKTLDSGGRVALYDYRDLNDPYDPHAYCVFETCTYERVETALTEMIFTGGGDEPESLLSASFGVMKELNWRLGSTKSLVVITDANYHSPDRDGTTFINVKKLSQTIDPVNIYVVTRDEFRDTYKPLAEGTGGAVVTSVSELEFLTTQIMERYDSLPRVEENDPIEKPHLEIMNTNNISPSEVEITFTTDGERTVVMLNDTILGITSETSVKVSGLDQSRENVIKLAPLSGTIRGGTVSVTINNDGEESVIIPKAPNTGAL